MVYLGFTYFNDYIIFTCRYQSSTVNRCVTKFLGLRRLVYRGCREFLTKSECSRYSRSGPLNSLVSTFNTPMQSLDDLVFDIVIPDRQTQTCSGGSLGLRVISNSQRYDTGGSRDIGRIPLSFSCTYCMYIKKFVTSSPYMQ